MTKLVGEGGGFWNEGQNKIVAENKTALQLFRIGKEIQEKKMREEVKWHGEALRRENI